MKSLQDLAKEAMAVQDACNLSGVVRSFARVCSDLWAMKPASEGTAWVNKHPICVVWADKICQLTGLQYYPEDILSDAYEKVVSLAGEGENEQSR